MLSNQMDFEYDIKGAPVIYSSGHKRPHNPLRRPKIRYRNMILSVIGCIILTISLAVISNVLWKDMQLKYRLLICIGTICLYMMAISKRAIIWLIHFYQNKASDRTRLRCVFEPSCSEYMIIAVEKYGTIRGVIKGVKRLYRCHPPNGGKDYP